MVTDWWHARQQELLILAERNCPLYVYNEEALNELFFDLLRIESVKGLVYPIYLNFHPEILRKAFEMNLSFLCTSRSELAKLLRKCPKLHPQRLLFFCDSNSFPELEGVFHHSANPITYNPSMHGANPTNTQIMAEKGIYIVLDSETTLDIDPLPEQSVKGFYIYQPRDDISTLIELLDSASKRYPQASMLILGNDIRASLFHRELDIMHFVSYLEDLACILPPVAVWLEVPAPLLSSIGILLVRIIETGIREGTPYACINIDIKAVTSTKLLQIVNLSTPDDEDSFMTCAIGNSQDLSDALYLELPSTSEAGDVLGITSMGIYAPGEIIDYKGRNGVPEHYLRARRICQVRI